jgi:hypothetical protein
VDNKKYGITDEVTPRAMVKCDGCDKDAPCWSQEELPENGLSLRLQTMDYYGGFSDFFEEEPSAFVLCHDCSLVLLTSLPLIAKKLPRGLHPCSLDTPCCDFAWRFDDGHVFYGSNGVWVHAELS